MGPANPDWKLMTSAPAELLASVTAWRSEPGPESFRLKTVNVAGTRRSSSASRPGRKRPESSRLARGVRANSLRLQERVTTGSLLVESCGSAIEMRGQSVVAPEGFFYAWAFGSYHPFKASLRHLYRCE